MDIVTAAAWGAVGGLTVSALSVLGDISIWQKDLKDDKAGTSRLSNYIDVPTDLLVLLTRICLGAAAGVLFASQIYTPLAAVGLGAAAPALLAFIGRTRGIAERYQANVDKETEQLRRSAGLPNLQDSSLKSDAEHQITELLNRIEKSENSQDIEALRKEVAELRADIAVLDSTKTSPEVSQLSMLADVFGQAIAQMKSSYLLSQTFATLGAIILLGGIALAIFRASSNGQQIAAIITSIAGVVTNLTAGLFFAQSNRARKHLEREADQFREDARAKQRQIQAEEVVNRVSDAARKDELRAHIVMRILGLQQDEAANSRSAPATD